MQILHKNKALLSLVALLAVIFAIGMVFDYKAPKIEAGTADNVSGWAWANTPQSSGVNPQTGTDQGLGWISFNCTDTGTCGTADYGVNIDPSTYDISGEAYIGEAGPAGAGSVGWLSFNSGNLTGCPVVGTCSAWVDTTVSPYELRGWGKVLSMFTENPANGWVSLNCKDASAGGVCGSSNFKVTMSPSSGKLSGYAWGSEVIGWIDFAPASAGDNGVAYNNSGSGSGPTACNNGTNDDGDSLIDHISINPTNPDPGCVGPFDTSEEQVPNYSVQSSKNLTATLGGALPVTSDSTTLSVTMINKGDLPFGGPFTGPIQLSVSASDIPGSTYNFGGAPASTYNLSEAQYISGVSFSVNVPAGTPNKAYTMTIRATGGGVSSYVDILLNSSTKKPIFIER